MMKILSNIFIRNLSPYPEGVKESFESSRNVFENCVWKLSNKSKFKYPKDTLENKIYSKCV